MDEYDSLSHSKWECKYHVVFIPKYRRKKLYKELRQHLGKVFKRLAEQKESTVVEGHIRPDHVHILLSIPPKYAVSQWLDSSRVRAQSTWRGCIGSGSRILWGRAFGRAGFWFQPWAATKP